MISDNIVVAFGNVVIVVSLKLRRSAKPESKMRDGILNICCNVKLGNILNLF